MDDKFLKLFLKTGLFEIGDVDDRLTYLEKSIKDLQEKLEKDNSLLPKYTLASFDPNISDTEPALIDTEAIVTNYWKTIRDKHPNMPINIYRGVILNALYNIGVKDATVARIIYLTGVNYYPYAKLKNEKENVELLLKTLGEIAEENAIEEWSLIDEEISLKLGTLKLNDLKFGSASINQANLKAGMKSAISNDPVTNHGSQNGGAGPWGDYFAKQSSEVITNAFNAALSEFNTSLSPAAIETPINKFFTEFKKSLDENLKSSFSSLRAINRRSELLWWKETLYSQSQKRSYRGFEDSFLPIIMSYDLFLQLPDITPVSVDYLLRDTVVNLLDKKAEDINFGSFLTDISASDIKAKVKPLFDFINESEDSEGRISVTDFIGLLVNDRLQIKDFKSRTGIAELDTVSYSELAVAILHDLLAKHLTKE